MLAGIAMFAIFASIHHSATSGLVLSQDFTGGTTASFSAAPGENLLNHRADIEKVLTANGFATSDIN